LGRDRLADGLRPLGATVLRNAFILGLGEAGFFPGIIVYLNHWFTERDRAKAVAFFFTAVPLSYIIGSPIADMVIHVNWFGLAGWRWIFIIEGIPALILGFANIWRLTDGPTRRRPA
jgi:MFS transporter, ACS family, tartrate transporter